MTVSTTDRPWAPACPGSSPYSRNSTSDAADSRRPLDAQIVHARGDDPGFSGADEQPHQRPGQQAHRPGEYRSEARADEKGLPRPLTDALMIPRAEILGHKGGIGVAEILHRQIGEGVDLHRRGKGRHNRRRRSVFTSPWIIRMPKFITDCCRRVRME